MLAKVAIKILETIPDEEWSVANLFRYSSYYKGVHMHGV